MNTKDKNQNELQEKIKELKEKLGSLLNIKNSDPGEILEISQQLDVLIVKEQRKILDQLN